MDPFRERRIEGVASAIQMALKKQRGLVACSGEADQKVFGDAEGGEARRFGKERKQLYDEAHPEKLVRDFIGCLTSLTGRASADVLREDEDGCKSPKDFRWTTVDSKQGLSERQSARCS